MAVEHFLNPILQRPQARVPATHSTLNLQLLKGTDSKAAQIEAWPPIQIIFCYKEFKT
jgi:hypothetical protein